MRWALLVIVVAFGLSGRFISGSHLTTEQHIKKPHIAATAIRQPGYHTSFAVSAVAMVDSVCTADSNCPSALSKWLPTHDHQIANWHLAIATAGPQNSYGYH